MTIDRPTGEYKSQMTTPPQAWPDADEDAHSRRAIDLLERGSQLKKAASGWDSTCMFIFDGHTWHGQASDAGKAKVKGTSDRMQSLLSTFADAIGFHAKAYESIKHVKEHIVANSDTDPHVIENLNALSSSSKDDQQKREDAIKAIVDQALAESTMGP
jgi:hypothetical protein